MIQILKTYEEQSKIKPKCVCFCLTRENCRKVSEFFNRHGLRSEVIDSTANEERRTDGIVSRFKEGSTQVLCATKGKID